MEELLVKLHYNPIRNSQESPEEFLVIFYRNFSKNLREKLFKEDLNICYRISKKSLGQVSEESPLTILKKINRIIQDNQEESQTHEMGKTKSKST